MLSDAFAYEDHETTLTQEALWPIKTGIATETLSDVGPSPQVVRISNPNPGQSSYRLKFDQNSVSPDFPELARKMIALMDLQPGWDSYDARNIELSTVVRSIELASYLLDNDTPTPEIFPTNLGGIQFQWEHGEKYLEIEVCGNDCLEIYFSDKTDPDSEVEGDFSHRMEELKQLIRKLR